MNKGVRDYTLLKRTISGIIGMQKLQIAQCGDSQPVSQSLKAPSLDHLDFGAAAPAKPTSKESIPERHGEVVADEPPRPIEPAGPDDVPKRGKKGANLIRYLLLTVLLIAANEIYGWPLRGSRWLTLQPYRTAVENVIRSKTSKNADNIQQPIIKNITGIAYSNDKPSAIIGDRIVHVGDIVSDAKIIEIGPKDVSFEADGRTWTQRVQ